jgi:hypothetical protein
MIIKKRGIYVTEKNSVPMMAICKSIGAGYDLSEIKNIYPITDDDICESIQFFCKYTDFDPYHILTFKKLEFADLEVKIQVQEISAECYMRMLNRSIYINNRLTNFDDMLLHGMNISFENACKLINGNFTEADVLNPALDKALANEIEMFMEMTKRNASTQIKKLDLENWDMNNIILLDSD